jgi:hypothetical protein
MLAIASTSPPVNVSGERELQDCPTICEEGVKMGLPDNLLNIYDLQGTQQTCDSIAEWLAVEDALFCGVIELWEEFIDFAAYCGCEGSTAPNLCEACSDGGVIEDPTQVVTNPFLNTTYTCEEGAELVSFLVSTIACATFTPIIDQACCGTAAPSTSSPIGLTPSPVAAPIIAPIPSPIATPTMTPSISLVPSSSPIQQADPTVVSPSSGTPVPSKAPTAVATPSMAPSESPATGGTSASTTIKLGLALCTNACVLLSAWVFLY